MRRAGAMVAVGFFIVGVAFAIFPFQGVTEEWAAQNSSSTTEVYQLVGLVAIGLVAFGLFLAGGHSKFPYPPVGFLAFIGVLMLVSWVGIGMVLGG